MDEQDTEYAYFSTDPSWSNHYLWPPLQKILSNLQLSDRRIFEVGCGSGATANMLAGCGFAVTAIDTSAQGVALARDAFPHVHFDERSAYHDLAAEYGTFPIVVSLEVIEHCFWPRKYAQTVHDLLQPGGVAIISTPYHGYLKNLALAVTNRLDDHFTALWDGGHIKFWSEKTLRILLEEAGFREVGFIRAGRIAPLAKSMIAIAKK